MSRTLPQPVTVNDILLAAAVEMLDQAVTMLGEIRDRLPQQNITLELAGGHPGGLEREPVHVTEPAPVKVPTKQPAKKAAPSKTGKES